MVVDNPADKISAIQTKGIQMTIIINTNNDAFQRGNRDVELARILREIARKFEQCVTHTGVIHDINGNVVGQIKGK